MNDDLAPEQIERELEESIEQSEGKIEGEDKGKKKPKAKESFVVLSKEEFEELTRREQFEYKIGLSKYKTSQLKNDFRDYKSKQTKSTKSLETRKLIILGRFLEAQLEKRPDRKVQYMVVSNHLDQFLTDNRDRVLLGFPPLEQPSEVNHDRN